MTRSLRGDCREAWHILHQADGGGPVWTLTQEVPDWITQPVLFASDPLSQLTALTLDPTPLPTPQLTGRI